MRKARVRHRKQLLMLIYLLELLFILCMLSFLLGKRVGEKNTLRSTLRGTVTDEVLTLSGQEPIYKEGIQEIETGKLTHAVQDLEFSLPEQDILLVNKDHPLSDDYEVELITLEDGKHQAAKEAYEPLCDMLKAGRREGLSFEICSSYRSLKRQQELFDEDVDALMKAGYSYSSAYEEVARETMPPGYSEHATGLAFDIVSHSYQMLDSKQKDTAENRWLREHCAEYGFILRYPEDKEEITKISYESWHFRYVGVEAAVYIMENHLTLEEYLDIKNLLR